MNKDFDTWNKKKKNIHADVHELYFYEREVWWCSVGVNVGYEEDGKNGNFARPVLVLRKFSKDVFVGIPLSTTNKTGKYYFQFELLGKSSTALLSQIRLFDSKRLVDKMGKVSKSSHESIREAVKSIL